MTGTNKSMLNSQTMVILKITQEKIALTRELTPVFLVLI